ncbi:MAG: sensor histidine kinase [Planctomycetota bacterium]|jgi:signal transduction histidine kinase
MARGKLPSRRYRRTWLYAFINISVIALTPLVIMTVLNSYEYQTALAAEMRYTVARVTSNSKRFMEGFLEERKAALTYVAAREAYEDLCDPAKLRQVLLKMNASFGAFVDLGVIDADGNQRSYVGPYELEGKNYTDQGWFQEASVRGVHVSDVFMGYRNVPHFVVAVRVDDETRQSFYILRATIDTEVLNRHLEAVELKPSSDIFLMNRAGILQTPSRHHGGILGEGPIATPAFSPRTEVLEMTTRQGEARLVGYTYVSDSPFVLVTLKHPGELMQGWLYLQTGMLWLLGVSIAVVMTVILWRSKILVNRIRDADRRREEALHNIEYTNKMASIGRMAAGVAHEINNPLAIINEKAGLLKDLLTANDEPPQRDHLLKNVEGVIKSVDRCSTITHRLLGFAKRIDPATTRIAVAPLIEEVLSFQEKEADYRSVTINLDIADDLPTIESDRGQLQQVFLNILGNAFAAVANGGRIDITARVEDENTVAVTISDNGSGIPEEHIGRIFEPFFTTKAEYGTGLGLSITYGIVERLGGRIEVQSTVGEGASFTVHLPVTRGGGAWT